MGVSVGANRIDWTRTQALDGEEVLYEIDMKETPLPVNDVITAFTDAVGGALGYHLFPPEDLSMVRNCQKAAHGAVLGIEKTIEDRSE
uniref:Uncharacterized protein n=1 Tax=Chromera velia CCMP2878 TaxID=1169474 RepID=A0A0G4FA47_9ALVE|eukprot:Cvel_15974.t1-p1 / transcript=Cvel_15974.t1 / gene=Cvel_15974 / organism=Chromera_velia_CCMP2878 / gene_product=hypothetical protein / transcript_product=hypothetical protein / location=Cvel_scaffold1209:49202-49462(-) / protein_length=87 / sequence_SO=supercontig / SO=protein_coding / is_pseudo=false